MLKKDNVWLGTPVKAAKGEFASPFTSRIGGSAALFREVSDATVFHCSKCKNGRAVSLLAQVYAPLDVYDRLLYVFTCSACSGENGTFCFALRSQNFNPSYVEITPTHDDDDDAEDDQCALFEENGDWGDGCDSKWEEDDVKEGQNESAVHATVTTGGVKAEEFHTVEVPSALAPSGSMPPIDGIRFPCFALDVFEEPPKPKAKSVGLIDQLQDAQEKYGKDAVDTTILDDETEPLREKRLRKYVERIGREPSQCVRWGPNQDPLRSSSTPITVPDCPHCGEKRQYEMQLTSPIIYFLTKAKDEKDHILHFGNILVFTCAGNCNLNAYTLEHCVVEEEI